MTVLQSTTKCIVLPCKVTTSSHFCSDTGDSSIKVYDLSEQTCSVVVGNGSERAPKMGVKRSFHSQQASALIMTHCSFTLDTHQQVPFA